MSNPKVTDNFTSTSSTQSTNTSPSSSSTSSSSSSSSWNSSLFLSRHHSSYKRRRTSISSLFATLSQIDYARGPPFQVSRTMIPKAVFREFPMKTVRKIAVSNQNSPEKASDLVRRFDDRLRLPGLTSSCRFWMEPDKSGNRSGHRNTMEPAVSVPDCLTWIV
ncbi:unnamed protein product [Adineta steineri]|uniref:Uncharacterized protein n=1 Tax=Adineta steineri TaxID=433720 RepID=A0A819HTB5_9BILA|nr:unnamed protein product [Adineta steineri]CAF1028544.1 unnamed protein product [Adineta steineri]CAF3902222.1 unnamed protein product [Adineta steineri]CAF4059479.1 unnamed protein product [Adineta steineri]